MLPLITAEPVPLTHDADGMLRVGHTRVTLQTVIWAFLEGATAEEIAYQYPTLNLADVYGVIAYYLHHQAEVSAYLKHWQQQAEATRHANETLFETVGVRERLLARRRGG